MPVTEGMKGDETIQFTTLFLALSAVSGSLPQQGEVPSDILHSLSELGSAERQQELHLLDVSYSELQWASGAFEGISGVTDLSKGSLAEIKVWRPLSPGDLSRLDECGFWPASWAPSENTFAAFVTGEININAIRSSGFIKSIKLWDASDYSSTRQPLLSDNLGDTDVTIEASWFGERRPAAANDTEEGRQLNRRVEIVILRSNQQE